MLGGGLLCAFHFGVAGATGVLAAIVLSVAFHELGHLAAARVLGVKATEWFVGLGPKLWSVTRGEVTYGVKLLPIGGHCTIIGMTASAEVDAGDEHRAFRSQRPWVQATIAMAGPAVNLVLAAALMFGANVAAGVSPGEAARILPRMYHSATVLSAKGLVQIPGNIPGMIGAAATGENLADPTGRVLSPVGAARLADQAVKAGWYQTLGIVGLVNLFIALFNLLPLPPLDGGHTVVAGANAAMSRVRGRRVAFDTGRLTPLTLAVVGGLALMGLASMVLDVTHPIASPF